MATLVAAAADLAAITSRARQCGLAAVDTEFVWTRTYYPVLGIIQIALGADEVYLVDAPAVTDKAPIAELLAAPDVVKILHDASSDLTILNRFCGGLPRNVFDLRLAAGFCGLTATLSLNRLLQEILGIDLAKTETRTDWLARPLSAAQVEYATDDVRHMPEVYRCLLARLCENGTQSWALAEMHTYEDPSAYEPDPPEKSYRNVKGMGRLNPEQLTVLAELATWRETTARQTDRPRGRILRDEDLIDLALWPPASDEDLRRGWRGRVREFRRHGEAILSCVATARRRPPEQWLEAPRCPLPAKVLKERCDAILQAVHAQAEPRGIDATMVGSRKVATNLVLAATRGAVNGHALLTGWRGELLSESLAPIMAAWNGSGSASGAPPAAYRQGTLF